MVNHLKSWTPNRLAWEKLAGTFPEYIRENKWTRVPFHQNHKNTVKIDSGVYIICAYSPLRKYAAQNQQKLLFDQLYIPMYVGSGNLRQRFSQHSGDKPQNIRIREIRQCFNENLDYWFCVIDKSLAKKFEDALERCFNPYANLMHPLKDKHSIMGDYILGKSVPVKTNKL